MNTIRKTPAALAMAAALAVANPAAPVITDEEALRTAALMDPDSYLHNSDPATEGKEIEKEEAPVLKPSRRARRAYGRQFPRLMRRALRARFNARKSALWHR